MQVANGPINAVDRSFLMVQISIFAETACLSRSRRNVRERIVKTGFKCCVAIYLLLKKIGAFSASFRLVVVGLVVIIFFIAFVVTGVDW